MVKKILTNNLDMIRFFQYSNPISLPKECTMVEMIKNAGPLVIALFFLSILTISFVIERFLVMGVARGKLGHQKFLSAMKKALARKDMSALDSLCKENKGSDSRVVRGLIATYEQHKDTATPTELKEELSDRVNELTAVEGSLLERNLIAMATIASIATMMGLLGTVVGMIRSFAALSMGESTAGPASQALARGIAEALVNTAGGLFVAITAIIFYNYFINRVDQYNFNMEESSKEFIAGVTGR